MSRLGVFCMSKREGEEMTPCDHCGEPIPTDVHEEELGMCVECSNKYYDHSDEEEEGSDDC